jgi:UPF0716 protein FxsA
MKAFQLLFLLVLIIPFLEIYLLIAVGGIIGAVPTVFLVVLTAALGAWLLKQQGLATFQRFQTSLAQGIVPAYEMVEGPIILVGGALLLTPGFITDLLGLACLIPQLRKKIARYVIENVLVRAGGPMQRPGPAEKDVLEGEFRKED